MNKNHERIMFLTKTSILAVLSFLMMYLKFPIPIAPSFYEIDLANVPTLIGGFALGPLAAFTIEALRTVLKLIFIPTTTAFVGELSGFLVNCILCVTAAWIYRNNKTKAGALRSLVISGILSVIAAAFTNYFLIIPAYVNIMGYPLEAIISMGNAIYSSVNSLFSLIVFCTIPFNVIKIFLKCLLVVILYKHISP
ncbi:MAG: ECF transporter S component, partial [Erysipelotrichaceae bacterium]|nr:ECF transporter S component [Erysipelotrichaceae bacterium]